jgi:1,4-alpha-glucan branching enzyme
VVAVAFALRAPGATRVGVAGDFNGWDPRATPLVRAAEPDLWVTSVALAPGVHTYAFVLEGHEWRPDPAAPLAGEMAFGTRRSVLLVPRDGVL